MRIKRLTMCLLLLPASVLANTTEGLYLSVGTGEVSGHNVDNDDVSFGLALGYRFNEHVAAEGFVRSFNLNPLIGWSDDRGYIPDEHYGIAVSSRAPLSDRFSVTARAGYGQTEQIGDELVNNRDRRVNESSFGTGLDWAVGGPVSLKLEYSRFFRSEVNLTSLEVSFHF